MNVSSVRNFFNAAGKLAFLDSNFMKETESVLMASRKAQGLQGFHKQVINAFKEGEQLTRNESILTSLKNMVTKLPSELKTGCAAKGFLGKLKGIGGPLLKRLPLLFVAMEVPNIVSAFKDKGFIGGIKEIGKTGIRMVTSMGAFIVGGAITPWCPLVGGLATSFATDWLVGKVIGKSHSQEKAEAEAKAKEALAQADASGTQAQLLQQQLAQQQSNPYATMGQMAQQTGFPQSTMTPQQLMYMQQMLQSGYGLPNANSMDQDFMALTSGMNKLNLVG